VSHLPGAPALAAVRRVAGRAPILLVLLLATGPALADAPCRGKLSGKVKGTFACSAEVTADSEGRSFFVITPSGPIPGVPACAPGAFELPGGPAAGSYTLDTLGMGRASVAAEGGTLYTATKTTGQRGEVRLFLKTVGRRSGRKPPVVHGTYRARLLPAGAGKTGEVLVEVRF
jgi:hypothetical protein